MTPYAGAEAGRGPAMGTVISQQRGQTVAKRASVVTRGAASRSLSSTQRASPRRRSLLLMAAGSMLSAGWLMNGAVAKSWIPRASWAADSSWRRVIARRAIATAKPAWSDTWTRWLRRASRTALPSSLPTTRSRNADVSRTSASATTWLALDELQGFEGGVVAARGRAGQIQVAQPSLHSH